MFRRFPAILLLGLCAAVAVVWSEHGGGPAARQAPTGPARLELLESVLSLGGLAHGEERVFPLRWARRGAGRLRVLGVRTGCGCAALEVPAEPLGPRARGAFRLRLRAGRRPGPFVHRVRIHTDAAPPHAVVECRLVGHVDVAIALWPAALELGRRTPGVPVERVVELRSATRLPPGLTFAWAGIAGRVSVEPAARPELPGAVLRLSLEVPQAAGPFRGALAVRAGPATLAVLPVRGVVD